MNTQTGFPNYNQNNHDDMLVTHAPLVKKIVLHLQARLPDSVQTDDLIQAGMIGLMEACKSFDASKGASFETYAGIRIRGAVIDEVRTSDWTPRSVSKNIREIAEAIQQVEARTGKKATDRDIAAQLEIPLEQYHKISREAAAARLTSTDELVDEDGRAYYEVPSPDQDPGQKLLEEDRKKSLATAISQLPEKEKLVMSLYYQEELNLKEIGAVLGVSESRVSQIHGQALARIRATIATMDA
ncbi:MAG: RNA polymerase sigma factor FliA [Thiotrichales bacterium]